MENIGEALQEHNNTHPQGCFITVDFHDHLHGIMDSSNIITSAFLSTGSLNAVLRGSCTHLGPAQVMEVIIIGM